MRQRMGFVAAGCVGIAIGAVVATASRDLVRPASAQPGAVVAAQPGSAEDAVIRIAKQISPAVVSVSRGNSSGSGVFVRRDGVVITNAHVVGNARAVIIGLADGRRLTGTVAGADPLLDIAIVRVPIGDAPVAPIGDSDRLEVGQLAIAIGNPLGLERTVTTGVVSAVNRSPRGLQQGGLIQTDAAISVGNSGGPLIDSRGRVIGINTAILQGPGASGLGFAIPINLANEVATQVLTTGRVQRAFLGISYGDIERELAAQFGLPVSEGIIVLEVVPGSPAARAGIRAQDIIVRAGGTSIVRGGDLQRVLRGLAPGDQLQLTLIRPSGQVTVTARLAEAPR